MQRASDHDIPQRGIEWMFRIGAVETLIAIAAAHDEIGGFKLGQLILHSLQREKTETSQLPHVQLLSWIGEQEPENLGADCREQPMQQRSLRHVRRYDSTALSGQVLCAVIFRYMFRAPGQAPR